MMNNILFDLGGVLIDLEVRRSVEAFMRLIDRERSRSAPISVMDLLGGGDSPLVQAYQVGAISTDDFIDALLPACHPGTQRRQLVDAWMAMLIGLPYHRLEVIKALKAKGVHVYVLSNINESHVEWTLRHFHECGATDWDGLFFSNEIHLAKPDAACYDYVLTHAGIRADETLYVDDLKQNIEAGERAGFHCLQAQGDEWIEPVKNMFHLE